METGLFAQRYAQRKVSLERAAVSAGVSVWEMMDFLRRSKLPVQYDLEDLQHDIDIIRTEDAAAGRS